MKIKIDIIYLYSDYEYLKIFGEIKLFDKYSWLIISDIIKKKLLKDIW